MGFLGALSALLDEDSDNSFEKKMNQALDKVEGALQSTLKQAEGGIKKVGVAAEKATATIDKVDQVSQTAAERLESD